ncbi:MAG: ATP-binding protein [Melioribacteraceae bacterium]|nr:ATP-binding protein [Melioribacteraceae bacterium]
MKTTEEERKKIFIVDDEEVNLKYFKRVLSKKYEVILENDSRDCLSKIKDVKPDIILLDVNMPEINGFELCKLIMNDKEIKNIPVIFVSSLRTPEHVKQGLEIGAVDFIARPINEVETFARIKTHLTIGQLQKELTLANSKLNVSLSKKTDELEDEKTDKQKISNALVESENRFQQIFKSAPEAIIIVNVDSGEIIDVNSAGCELFGYTYEELIGLNPSEFLIPSKETIKKNYFKIKENNTSSTNIRMSLNTLIRKDGEIISVQNSSKTILIEGELYIFSSIYDLRARHEVEMELQQAKEKAEELSRIKGFFLENMSHELRTPLVGILGFSGLLEEELEDESLKEMAVAITTSGKRLLNTLKVLLEYSVLEGQENKHNWKAVNLNEIVADVVESYSASYKDRGLDVIIKCEEDEIFITADEYFMTEVIAQLLNNAITYTHFGSITITLETEKTENRKFVIISIKDTGIGISEEKLSSIFDDFRQASEGYSRQYEGLGLGLTLVKNITDLHNGEITVQSKENEGSLFKLKLELEKESLIKEVS